MYEELFHFPISLQVDHSFVIQQHASLMMVRNKINNIMYIISLSLLFDSHLRLLMFMSGLFFILCAYC